MPSIDWDNIQNEMGGNFKSYAPDGKYKTKCIGVEIKEVGQNKSIIQKFQFEDGEYAYPTADHWLTFKDGKSSFRVWHQKNLLVVLGATEDAARKAVEMCESKGKKEDIVKAYEQTFGKLLNKKPEVEIEVYQDGKYAKAEFADRSVAFSRDSSKDKDAEDTESADDEEISIDEIPF